MSYSQRGAKRRVHKQRFPPRSVRLTSTTSSTTSSPKFGIACTLANLLLALFCLFISFLLRPKSFSSSFVAPFPSSSFSFSFCLRSFFLSARVCPFSASASSSFSESASLSLCEEFSDAVFSSSSESFRGGLPVVSGTSVPLSFYDGRGERRA